MVSTILTPAGLPIEGGGSSAVSRFAGYIERTPIDVMLEAPIAAFKEVDVVAGWYSAALTADIELQRICQSASTD